MSLAGNGKEYIITDGRISTLTGRQIPVPPRIRVETNRKCINDLKKHDAWLIEQVREEALSRGDDYNLLWINRMKPGDISPSDKDCANLYLFGEECIVCRCQ